MVAEKALTECVQRARRDIAEDDAQCTETQRGNGTGNAASACYVCASRMHPQRLVATILTFTFALLCVPIRAASSGNPFAFGASVGPSAASRVSAYVTRTVNGKREMLPAAAVPALQAGDDVVVSFPDYTRPPARVNYHANVAFITGNVIREALHRGT